MIRVVNWSSLQSYKDRKPTWIRLHRSLLDNYEYHSMSLNARALLPMIWLLASEDKNPKSGLLQYSYENVSFRLRVPVEDVRSAVEESVKCGFLEEVTEPYQECSEDVTTEAEAKAEAETDAASVSVIKDKFPELSGHDIYGKPLEWVCHLICAIDRKNVRNPSALATKMMTDGDEPDAGLLSKLRLIIDPLPQDGMHCGERLNQKRGALGKTVYTCGVCQKTWRTGG